MKTFILTENHLKLLARAYIGWEDGEYGAPAMDSKRPYGNSDVEGDICEIIGVPSSARDDQDEEYTVQQRADAAKLHKEMQTVLQLACLFAGKGGLRVGTYAMRKDYDYQSWEHQEQP